MYSIGLNSGIFFCPRYSATSPQNLPFLLTPIQSFPGAEPQLHSGFIITLRTAVVNLERHTRGANKMDTDIHSWPTLV
ncbi:hypothetical protein DPEC_G00026980 [Dallia pectoralis]|uniref:Uncharacterized protein n=1 Tax=Dallia pectoralis TaxID=75939 RepID=A0ACC2HIP9_DALPE|nr:hypothetical protein DPEC_G00026980 [Dallia pectoralis]